MNRQLTRSLPALAAMTIAVGILAGCGSRDNGVTTLPVGTAKIQGVMRSFQPLPGLSALTGASVTGLGAGLSVTLENNGGDDVTLKSNSAFSFPTELAPGSSYAVTVKNQPLGQTCTVDSGTGTIDAQGTSIANVSVNCKATSSIGGGLRGLNAGESVSILNNGIVTTLGANGGFALPGTSIPGSQYAVTVFAQPANGICTVSNGTGLVVDNVMGLVGVSCASTAPSVKGSLSGLLAGERVEIQNNAGDTIGLTSDQAFAFATNVGANAAYAVTVSKQPVTQLCTVANGSGTIDANGAVVSNIAVNCAASSSVGGKVDGLAPGVTLVLSNGGATVSVTSNGLYAFPGLQSGGTSYSVSVASQPAGQVCQVTGGSGVAVDGATSSVGVKCLSVSVLSLTMPAPVAIGTSAQGAVSVTNTTGTAVSVSATTTGDFSTTQDCSSIAAGATCSIPVAFNPTQTGPAAGGLTLVVDGGTPIVVALSAQGAPTPGTLVLDNNVLNFNRTVAGQFSFEQVVTVTNAGGSTATIGTPTSQSAEFILTTNTCPAALEPGESCSMGVRFSPVSASSFDGYPSSSLDVPYDGRTVSIGLNGWTAAAVPVVAQISGTLTGLLTMYGGYPTNAFVGLTVNGVGLFANTNGAFSLQSAQLDANGAYSVRVQNQPVNFQNQTCVVTDGDGVFVNGVASTSPNVTCSGPATQQVHGVASGITAPVQLMADWGYLTLTSDGAFTLYPTPSPGQSYTVQVTNSGGLNCKVTDATGTFDSVTGMSTSTPNLVCTP